MRTLTLALLISAVLLTATGCGGQVEAPKLREFFADVAVCVIDARVHADFGDRTVDYFLRYERTPAAETVTVLEPSELADIKVTILPEAGRLLFDGLILETGALPGTGLSPLEAVPYAFGCWQAGYSDSVRDETLSGVEAICAVYNTKQDSKPMRLVTWFDKATYRPLRSETYAGDCCVLWCEYEKVGFN